MDQIVKNIDKAFIYIIGFSLVLLTGITITMIYFTIRYRRSKNPNPSDLKGNWKVEFIWTIIPLFIVLSMFYVGWDSYVGLRNVPKGAMEIDVLGMQYQWVFTYSNKKESNGVLVVPLGRPIKLNISSDDVIHSLYIPSFRIKVDAVRGMKTYEWFMPDKIGNYNIFCAEYCGVDHSLMSATLRIVSQAEFEKWIKQKE